MIDIYSRAVESETGCWLWQGSLDEHGYGRVIRNKKRYRLHRVSYELMVADIPDGLVIDHLCRTRNCINPYHMEPVPQSVNAARGNTARSLDRTHCKRGHELTEANTNNLNGWRRCKTCQAAASARCYNKKKMT